MKRNKTFRRDICMERSENSVGGMFIHFLIFLFSCFDRRKLVCPNRVNGWTWSGTRWNCATRSYHLNSRPRPWNWRRSWIRTRRRVRHRQAAAVTSACNLSDTDKGADRPATRRRRLHLRPICWASRPPSPASLKSVWWAVKTFWRTFLDDHDVIPLTRLPMTWNLSLKARFFTLFWFSYQTTTKILAFFHSLMELFDSFHCDRRVVFFLFGLKSLVTKRRKNKREFMEGNAIFHSGH